MGAVSLALVVCIMIHTLVLKTLVSSASLQSSLWYAVSLPGDWHAKGETLREMVAASELHCEASAQQLSSPFYCYRRSNGACHFPTANAEHQLEEEVTRDMDLRCKKLGKSRGK